jgi:hypothetical protein
MKAIIYHNSGSGDVLKLEEVEKPVPRDDEVLIKVRAASVLPQKPWATSGSAWPPDVRRWLRPADQLSLHLGCAPGSGSALDCNPTAQVSCKSREIETLLGNHSRNFEL